MICFLAIILRYRKAPAMYRNFGKIIAKTLEKGVFAGSQWNRVPLLGFLYTLELTTKG